jgi:hypothetical protein
VDEIESSLHGQTLARPDCRTFARAFRGVAPRPPSEEDGGRARRGPPGLLPPLSGDFLDLPRLRPRPRLLWTDLLRSRPPRQPPPRAAPPPAQSRRSSRSPGSRARAPPAPPASPARGGSRFFRPGLVQQSAGLAPGGLLECSGLEALPVASGRGARLRDLPPAPAPHHARTQTGAQARARPRRFGVRAARDLRSPARRDPTALLRRALAHRHDRTRARPARRHGARCTRHRALPHQDPGATESTRSLPRLSSQRARAVPAAARHAAARDDRGTGLCRLRGPDPPRGAAPAAPPPGRGVSPALDAARGAGPGRLGSLRQRAGRQSPALALRLRDGAVLVPRDPRALHPGSNARELPARPRRGRLPTSKAPPGPCSTTT